MRVAVIGAGAMGSGIAQVFIEASQEVVLFDVSPDSLNRASVLIRRGLSKRGKQEAFRLLHLTQNLDDCAGFDAAIEAAPEKLGLKLKLFESLDRLLPAPALLGSNTSSIPIRELARACRNPERLIGTHFFNPVPLMRVMEVIPSRFTDAGTKQRALDLARMLDKEAVISKDEAGFIANRILMPFGLAAFDLAHAGRARPDALDEIVKKYGHLPMGPFELMDFIGLDVVFEIAGIIYDGLPPEPLMSQEMRNQGLPALGRPERFQTAAFQESQVSSGRLGRKTREGFYRYGETGRPEGLSEKWRNLPGIKPQEEEELYLFIMSAVINEAFLAMEQGVADADSIDRVFVLGCRWPQGPFEYFHSLGPAKVFQAAQKHAQEGSLRHRPLSQALKTASVNVVK